MSEENVPLVVVGVDGSDHEAAALREALHEADRRGGRVLAVSAWERRELTLDEYYGVPVYDAADDHLTREQRIREHVDEILATEPGVVHVRVDVDAVSGRAGEVLVERGREADLLVVGHRGRGGLRSVALGRLNCVLHAPCPVLVVPMTTAAAPGTPCAVAAAR